ncbi:sigma 54-interacting transcriptional regulator [Pelosinus sp. sgz500959]|uniref:sigma 54-interacting transcriptional regulator n=1 Tax=Pelosinus sp. sgz500959 TaxID=3242472 RepID=UPI0036720EAB
MQEYVIQIDFIDRPGLGYEIFSLTERNHIDKIAMEVLPNQGMVIKFCCDGIKMAHQLMDELRRVPEVRAVDFRDQMPYEEREDTLKTILNSVDEGILGIDKEGKITHINEVFSNLFLSIAQDVIGCGVEEILGKNHFISETLRSGKTYTLQEGRVKKVGKRIRYLMSSQPIMNDRRQIIGAVATITDFRQAEAISSKVDKIRHLKTFDEIIFQSEKMSQLITAARTVARSCSTVLLRGESGTGKELFASALHTGGPRRQAPFIAVNCTALPENLLESELFGYEEGAFTGASKGGKRGLFEQADGGTLFLDEIGELPLLVQVRLLRTLQEGTIRRVGGSKELRVDVRIVAATHRNLEEMVRKGEFREDLYYRLNVIPFIIPSLRERKEDIPLLAQHLIGKICAKLHKPEAHLTRDSVRYLMNQEWPGNVRQLENTLERIINLLNSREITPHDFAIWSDIGEPTGKAQNTLLGKNMMQIEIPNFDTGFRLKEVVAHIEKEILIKVLERYPSSRLAGQVLGVSNTTVLNKMKNYRL